MNTILEKAAGWLDEFNIQNELRTNQLWVNRASLSKENEAWGQDCIKELQKSISTKIFVAGGNEEFHFLETF